MYSTRPKILCVEDHQDTLELFVIVLSQLKYEVIAGIERRGSFERIARRAV